MIRKPPARLLEAINQGLVTVNRRAALFEADQVTRYFPGEDDEASSRLIDGSITLDYSRDERRTFDCVLNNGDHAIDADRYGGFWYDKILKFYRGYTYPAISAQPKIGIVEEVVTNAAYELRNVLYQIGYTDVTVQVGANTVGDLGQYDIVFSYTLASATTKYALLSAAHDVGINVVTISRGNSHTTLPNLYTASSITVATNGFKLTPTTYDTPLAGGWSAETYTSSIGQGFRATALAAGVVAASTALDSGTTHYTANIKESDSGGKWFDLRIGSVPQTQGKILLSNALKWMWTPEAFKTWEVQLGEFMIDKIDYKVFPNQVAVNGRDFTKKCLLSKFAQSLAFDKGTNIKDIVSSLAGNAGIFKTNLHMRAADSTADDLLLDSRLEIARETSRWEIMKKVTNSFGFELYFDAEGYLTTRPYLDPSTDPISHVFSSGPGGDLASVTKSLNDSLIFNDIIVTGERGANKLPYNGRARNVDPSSPTNITDLGDRPWFYSSSQFKSNEHCRRFADRMLKIHALESYDIAFESLYYPWQEVGEIVQILDPNRAAYEPTRYLLSSLNLPMGLGVMSGSAKRVTIIQSESDYTAADLAALGVPGIETVEQAEDAKSDVTVTSATYKGKLPGSGLE